MLTLQKKWFWLIPVLLVYIYGMFVDVMEIDAAQYAEMSREMLTSANPLKLYCRGNNYLDKPPFLFWITAVSFKLFGVSGFTYKLPSVLFSLLGCYATYRLGKRLYGEETGFVAAWILSTTVAWFLINNDVRTDTILASAVVFSVWQLKAYIDEKKTLNLLGSITGIAIAMLTKGPIGLMVPVLAIGADLVWKRDWRALFRWEWLLLVAGVLLLLSPMLWGLYTQFDQHPGQIINQDQIHSGIRFYFWTQSFGRLTGESKWVNDPNPLSFIPVLLWSFLPWSFLLLGAIGNKVVTYLKSWKKGHPDEEIITLAGFVLPFIALSLSRFKLPHYIFVIYPLGAIMSARYYQQLRQGTLKGIWLRVQEYIQLFFLPVVLLAALLLYGFIFPLPGWQVLLFTGLSLVFMVYVYQPFIRSDYRLLRIGAIAALLLNLAMNLQFYPNVLRYQTTSYAAQYYYAHASGSGVPVVAYHTLGYAFDFYSRRVMTYYENEEQIAYLYKDRKVWIYTTEEGKNMLQANRRVLHQVEFDDYKATRLTFMFLNPFTRNDVVQKKYLLLVQY